MAFRGRPRLPLLAAALVLSLVPTAVQVTSVAPSAHAVDTSKGTPGYCPDANGVTVIIDFQELGGTTIVRCARGEQATGHAALKNAGIEIGGVARWGESFICRIEGKPGPNSEPCIDTPPASAYWSYWHAPNGGAWTYSQWGVMNRKPPLGSFEGWSFSKDKTETTNPSPRIAPRRPAAAASPSPPRTQAPKPPADTTTSGGGTSSGNGGGSSSGNSGGGSSSSGGGGSTTAGSGTTGSTSGSSTSTGTTSDGSTAGGSTSTGSASGRAASGGSTPAEPPPAIPAVEDPLGPGPGVSGNPMEPGQPGQPGQPGENTTPTGTPSVIVDGSDSPEPSAAPSGITPQGQVWTGGEELARKDDDGIPATTIVGAGLLVALCAAAGFTAWRRRAATSGSG